MQAGICLAAHALATPLSLQRGAPPAVPDLHEHGKESWARGGKPSLRTRLLDPVSLLTSRAGVCLLLLFFTVDRARARPLHGRERGP